MYYKIEDVVIELDDDAINELVKYEWKIHNSNKNRYVYTGNMNYLHHVIAAYYFSTYDKKLHRVKFIDGNIYNIRRNNLLLQKQSSNIPYLYRMKNTDVYSVQIRDKGKTILNTYTPDLNAAKLVLVRFISNNVNVIYNQLLVNKLDITTFMNSRQFTYLITFSDLFDELDIEFPSKLSQLRDNYIKLVEVFNELNKEIP